MAPNCLFVLLGTGGEVLVWQCLLVPAFFYALSALKKKNLLCVWMMLEARSPYESHNEVENRLDELHANTSWEERDGRMDGTFLVSNSKRNTDDNTNDDADSRDVDAEPEIVTDLNGPQIAENERASTSQIMEALESATQSTIAPTNISADDPTLPTNLSPVDPTPPTNLSPVTKPTSPADPPSRRPGLCRLSSGIEWLNCLALVLCSEVLAYCFTVILFVVCILIFQASDGLYHPEHCGMGSRLMDGGGDACRKSWLSGATVVTLTGDESVGAEIWGYVVDGRNDGMFAYANATVVFLHGNSGDVLSQLPHIIYRNLYYLGFRVLTLDPPGYGASSGETDEVGWRRACRAAIDYALNLLDGDRSRLLLYGRSMGGAAAAITAAEESSENFTTPLAGLILEVPLDSMGRLFKDFFRLTGYALSQVWSDDFDGFNAISNYTGCLFHFAAEKDDLILTYRQKSYFAAARRRDPSCSFFMLANGLGHIDSAWFDPVFNRSIREEFFEKIPSWPKPFS